MKLKRPTTTNIVFIIIILLMIIPQTRQPIQVFLHKGLALFSPSEVSVNKRKTIEDYNWTLKSLDGLNFDFKQTKGKVVLINFWATWCAPCIAEMPALQELYDDYGNKIEFLLVSQESETVIQKFLNKHNYSFKIYSPVTDVPEALKTSSIPRTLIIDKKGDIIIDKTGAANWNSNTVRKTLDNLIVE